MKNTIILISLLVSLVACTPNNQLDGKRVLDKRIEHVDNQDRYFLLVETYNRGIPRVRDDLLEVSKEEYDKARINRYFNEEDLK